MGISVQGCMCNDEKIVAGSHGLWDSSSRRLRTHALISSFPPGKVPKAPAYFSNGFPAVRAGRMTVSLPCTMNSTRSPALKPNRVRILFGTVTCPFELRTLESAISLTLNRQGKGNNPYIAGQNLSKDWSEPGQPDRFSLCGLRAVFVGLLVRAG